MTTRKATAPTPMPAAAPVAAVDDAVLQKDVDALAGSNGQTFTVDDSEFRIRPLKVKQFFPFLALVRPLLSALANRPTPALPPADADQGGGILDPQTAAALADGEWILGLLEKDGPTIIQALAVGIEQDQDAQAQEVMVARLEDLTMVGLVVVLKHFVVVNAGFFASQGLQLPKNPLGQFGGNLAGAASQPSP